LRSLGLILIHINLLKSLQIILNTFFSKREGIFNMKIKIYWPKCNFINKEWSDHKKVDSYWVESTYKEAVRYVFPYLNPKKIKNCEEIWKLQQSGPKYSNKSNDYLCFLISKNLEAITPMPWFYPYSGHWGPYSPFVSIKETKITELEGLISVVP